MSNVRIFTRINKSRQVTPSLPLNSEEQLPVINPNPTGQAIRHNSTLDKNGGDSDNDYYGHNTEDIQDALEGSNLPSAINVFATVSALTDYAYISNAPNDGKSYVRKSNAWTELSPFDLKQEAATDGQALVWSLANSRYQPTNLAASYVRHDINTQGLSDGNQLNARTNIGAQATIAGTATEGYIATAIAGVATWRSLNLPDYNNKNIKLQIDESVLSGTGTIEAQVAAYINANIAINRIPEQGTLFIEITSFPPNPGEISTSGLQLYYNFAGENDWFDGSGSYVKDFSPVAINGNLSGGVSWADGGVGGFMEFRAANSRWVNMNRTSDGLGVLNNNYSIVMTVRFPDVTVPSRVVGTLSGASAGESLQVGANESKAWIDVFASGMMGGSLADNAWAHLTFTFNTSGDDIIYINGASVASSNFSSFSGDVSMAIARWGSTYHDFDLGSILIYDRELTPTEVDNIYQAQRTRFSI